MEMIWKYEKKESSSLNSIQMIMKSLTTEISPKSIEQIIFFLFSLMTKESAESFSVFIFHPFKQKIAAVFLFCKSKKIKDFSLLFFRKGKTQRKVGTCNVEVYFSFAQFFLLLFVPIFLSYYSGVKCFLFFVCVVCWLCLTCFRLMALSIDYKSMENTEA